MSFIIIKKSTLINVYETKNIYKNRYWMHCTHVTMLGSPPVIAATNMRTRIDTHCLIYIGDARGSTSKEYIKKYEDKMSKQ
jgi:hypothetical protein